MDGLVLQQSYARALWHADAVGTTFSKATHSLAERAGIPLSHGHRAHRDEAYASRRRPSSPKQRRQRLAALV